MPFQITQFETTPNPNALKCWLDRPISDRPRSFLNSEMAGEDPIAAALFAKAGVTNVYFNGDWMTINKLPDAAWPSIKSRVRQVLAEAGVS
jgi:hypothetical protein